MPRQVEPQTGRVRCPRCHFGMSERLHMITASDAFNCPRCQGLDDLTIPMFLEGESADPAGERTIVPFGGFREP